MKKGGRINFERVTVKISMARRENMGERVTSEYGTAYTLKAGYSNLYKGGHGCYNSQMHIEHK